MEGNNEEDKPKQPPPAQPRPSSSSSSSSSKEEKRKKQLEEDVAAKNRAKEGRTPATADTPSEMLSNTTTTATTTTSTTLGSRNVESKEGYIPVSASKRSSGGDGPRIASAVDEGATQPTASSSNKSSKEGYIPASAKPKGGPRSAPAIDDGSSRPTTGGGSSSNISSSNNKTSKEGYVPANAKQRGPQTAPAVADGGGGGSSSSGGRRTSAKDAFLDSLKKDEASSKVAAAVPASAAAGGASSSIAAASTGGSSTAAVASAGSSAARASATSTTTASSSSSRPGIQELQSAAPRQKGGVSISSLGSDAARPGAVRVAGFDATGDEDDDGRHDDNALDLSSVAGQSRRSFADSGISSAGGMGIDDAATTMTTSTIDELSQYVPGQYGSGDGTMSIADDSTLASSSTSQFDQSAASFGMSSVTPGDQSTVFTSGTTMSSSDRDNATGAAVIAGAAGVGAAGLAATSDDGLLQQQLSSQQYPEQPSIGGTSSGRAARTDGAVGGVGDSSTIPDQQSTITAADIAGEGGEGGASTTPEGIQAFVSPADDFVTAENVAVVISPEEEERQEEMKKRKYMMIAIGIAIVIIIIAVVAGVVVGGGGGGDGGGTNNGGNVTMGPKTRSPTLQPSAMPSFSPSFTPTTSELTAVIQAIVENGISNETSFNDRNSPQYLAANWIANDDEANVNLFTDPDWFTQRYILAVFYFATGGDGWLQCSRLDNDRICERNFNPWLKGPARECNDPSGVNPWLGIKCNENNEIIELSFRNNDFQGNNLVGSLPEELYELTTLKELGLQRNKLQGSLSESLGKLSSMELLLLLNNDLTGEIPETFLQNGINLSRLLVDGNELTGTISTLYGTMPKLSDLRLSRNNLHGQLPQTMGLSTSLHDIEFFGNYDIDGIIPESFFNIDEPILETLEIGSCSLSGELPNSLYSQINLLRLELMNNTFTGEIKNENIVQLYNLKTLSIENNTFSGSIPNDAFDVMTNLTTISLHNNNFVGSISSIVCDRYTSGIITKLTTDCLPPSPDVTCTCCDVDLTGDDQQCFKKI